ncbi:MAG TPA: response regulator [Methanospirillum sp.]|uniref:response regulator n=1 Tax=Methanospirillum sp. TaxID=45200 RepID=UPI002BAEF56D|nr:response regulator [Methanospirillum sp.]HWQ64272.1 response regulator [Methanospirillum sp.]
MYAKPTPLIDLRGRYSRNWWSRVEGGIFIVEDNPVINDLISWRLTELGFSVMGTAEDYLGALEKLEQYTPDKRPKLVLMDINLPGEKDGIMAAEEIQNKFSIPIVYISSVMDDPTIERAKLTKPRGFIVKPFTDNQLKATVEMALQK